MQWNHLSFLFLIMLKTFYFFNLFFALPLQCMECRLMWEKVI